MNRIALFFILAGMNLQAQQAAVTDSLSHTIPAVTFNYKQLIAPAVLIGYGVIGLENDRIKDFNAGIRDEVIENIDRKFTVDDFTPLAPALSVYALNAAGIAGKHGFRDRTVIIATSYTIMAVTVLGLKGVTDVDRPDGTTSDSFPSGHTAVAFVGAEFLMQEYKHKSVWYGIAGYAVAAGTGIFRMINNRHWLTDVAAGAGIGILSTKIAYWIHPLITKTFFKNETKATGIILPIYDGQNYGLGMAVTF